VRDEKALAVATVVSAIIAKTNDLQSAQQTYGGVSLNFEDRKIKLKDTFGNSMLLSVIIENVSKCFEK